MGYLIICVAMICVSIAILPVILKRIRQAYSHAIKHMAKHFASEIFFDNYFEVRALYLQEFGETPSMNYISNIQAEKAATYISSGAAGKVLAVRQRNYYNWQEQKREISSKIFTVEHKILIEIRGDGVKILYNNADQKYAEELVEALVPFKAPDKEKAYQINVITNTSEGLALKQLEMKPMELNIDLYYNDDFREVDAVIKERLAKENDKGIILLHGLPGTGKTTYLRHLIGSMKKKVLFVSPSVASNLMNPEFLDLLIEHSNSVLVIEDAENIIMDRRQSSNSSVSNLLNISDGLLSDCLNVQIICTFNSALHLIDNALMRKGRLIAKYEFGKLGVAKARRLSSHLGLQQTIDEPMTLADITNSKDKNYAPAKVSVIGFRRTEELVGN